MTLRCPHCYASFFFSLHGEGISPLSTLILLPGTGTCCHAAIPHPSNGVGTVTVLLSGIFFSPYYSTKPLSHPVFYQNFLTSYVHSSRSLANHWSHTTFGIPLPPAFRSQPSDLILPTSLDPLRHFILFSLTSRGPGFGP